MTVSRVLREPWRVSSGTRERVQTAIDELGYRPNFAARSLVTRRSRTIGVVALNTTLFGPAALLHGIEEAACDAGFFVSIASPSQLTADAVRASVHRLMAQSVDGVVIVAPFRLAHPTLDTIIGPVPVVVVEGPRVGGPPGVGVDQELGGRLAVEHLLGLGHRTVHHISGPRDWTESEGRANGWRGALRAAQRRVPAVAVGDWSAGSGYRATQALLTRSGVTAIFTANDMMALGALRALHEAGPGVPLLPPAADDGAPGLRRHGPASHADARPADRRRAPRPGGGDDRALTRGPRQHRRSTGLIGRGTAASSQRTRAPPDRNCSSRPHGLPSSRRTTSLENCAR
jgi:DNA-binding LacI/PurR family transcriptional regulator